MCVHFLTVRIGFFVVLKKHLNLPVRKVRGADIWLKQKEYVKTS